MAFQQIEIPTLRLIHGTSKSRGDNTVVFGNGYKEYRIRRSSIDPMIWSFPARDLLAVDANDLIEFYNQVDGGLDSFLFTDEGDKEWVDYKLTYLDSERWKVTSNSGSPITHGTITSITNNGSNIGTRTIQTDSSHPYITILGTNANSDIRINGTFQFEVRFNSPLSYAYNALDVDNNIAIVGFGAFELKELT